MATYNLNADSTVGMGSNKIAIPSTRTQGEYARMYQSFLDIDHLVANGYTNADGDIFQMLLFPANTVIHFAGAQVLRVFNGTTPTVDIDWAAGDDIIDGGDVTALGYLVAGTNGQTNTINTADASTFAHLLGAEDTIDVKLIAGSADVTSGLLRVYALATVLRDHGGVTPQLAPRDQLA